MENLQTLLNQTLLENRVGNLLWFVGIILLGILLKNGLSLRISQVIYRFIQRESGNVPVSDFVRLTRKPFEWLIALLVLYAAFSRLRVPADWDWAAATEFGVRMVLLKGFYSIAIVSVTWLGVRLIKFAALIGAERAARTPSPLDDQLVPFFKDLGILVWLFTCFFFLLNKIYQVNVWALITSLGIGGLVVALAARETIENIISSVTIMIERPFIMGDSVLLGLISGEVEKIGFRSTRIRADDGSLLTVPNRLMVSQALENLTQRQYRRHKLILKLVFSTPSEALTLIMKDAEAYLIQHQMANLKPPVVRLEGFGEHSFEVLVIYWVNSTDWREFIAVREEVNLQLIEIVQRHGAAFAVGFSRVG